MGGSAVRAGSGLGENISECGCGRLPCAGEWSAHVSGCVPSHHMASVSLSSGREVYARVLTRIGFGWYLPRGREAEGSLPLRRWML